MNPTWLVATSLTTLLATGQQPGWETIRIDPAEDLVTRIGRITGESPVNCGRLMNPGNWGRPAYRVGDLLKPIACATLAAGARRPFVVVLKTLGFDSWTATGLLGGPDGGLQLFTYDNLYGQGNLRTSTCETPDARVNADGFAYIACDSPQASIRLQPTAARAMMRPLRLTPQRQVDRSVPATRSRDVNRPLREVVHMTRFTVLPSEHRARHWIVGATLILCSGFSISSCDRSITEPSPILATAAPPGFDMTGIWQGQYLETACQSTTCPVCCSSRGKTERRQTLRVTVTQDTGALTGMWDEVPQEFTGTLRGSIGGRVSGIEASLSGLLYPVAATSSPVPLPQEPWSLRSFSAQLNTAGTALSGSFTLVSLDATGRETMQLRNDLVSLTRVQ